MESVEKYYRNHYKEGLYKGLEGFTAVPTMAQFDCIRKLNTGLTGKWLHEFRESYGKSISKESEKEIRDIIKTIGRNVFVDYLRKYSVREFEVFISRNNQEEL